MTDQRETNAPSAADVGNDANDLRNDGDHVRNANGSSDDRAAYESLVVNDISLTELLSSCIDACRRGCEVIRNVRRQSLLLVDDDRDALTTTDGQNLGVKYKIINDPRSALTEADEASQKVIMACLRHVWGKEIEKGVLRVVGEEEVQDAEGEQVEAEGDNGDVAREGEQQVIGGSKDDGGTENDGVPNENPTALSPYSIFDKYSSPRPNVEAIQRYLFSGEISRWSSDSQHEQRSWEKRSSAIRASIPSNHCRFDTFHESNIPSLNDNNNPSHTSVPTNKNIHPSNHRNSTDSFNDNDTSTTKSLYEKTHSSSLKQTPIIIFIDPMDGTREFVENRIENVQCLSGITYNGFPIGSRG